MPAEIGIDELDQPCAELITNGLVRLRLSFAAARDIFVRQAAHFDSAPPRVFPPGNPAFDARIREDSSIYLQVLEI